MSRTTFEPFRTDDYLTDGTRLYRVIRSFGAGVDRYAELEDCRTLESLLTTSAQLEHLRLRLVRRSPVPAFELVGA
jgi:hypothetical protein